MINYLLKGNIGLFIIIYFITLTNLFSQVDCIPNVNDQYEWIQECIINDVSFKGSRNDGYNISEHQGVPIIGNTDYQLVLTPGYADIRVKLGWAIFVDFNKDGDFDDNKELIVQLTPEIGTHTINFSIPSTGIVSGNYNLRVGMKYYDIPFSCSYDEKADYFDIPIELNTASTLEVNVDRKTENSLHFNFIDAPSQRVLEIRDKYGVVFNTVTSEDVVNVTGLSHNKAYYYKCKREGEQFFSDEKMVTTLPTNERYKISNNISTPLSSPIILTDPSNYGELYKSRENIVQRFIVDDSLFIGMYVNYLDLESSRDYLVATNQKNISSKTLEFYLSGDNANGRWIFSNSSELFLTFLTNSSKQKEGFEVVLAPMRDFDQALTLDTHDTYCVVKWENEQQEEYTIQLYYPSNNTYRTYSSNSSQILIDELSKGENYEVCLRKKGTIYTPSQTFKTLQSPPKLVHKSIYENAVSMQWSYDGTGEFEVFMSEGEFSRSFVTTSKNITISDLLPSTLYNVKVKEKSSKWSENIVIKTPHSKIEKMSSDTLFISEVTHTDPEGINSFYSKNQEVIQVLRPQNEGEVLEIDFIDFFLEPGVDYLEIYDDNDVLITRITGDYYKVGKLVSTSESGGFKLKFFSDYSTVGIGWVMNISSLRKAPQLLFSSSTSESIAITVDADSTDFINYSIYEDDQLLLSIIDNNKEVTFSNLSEAKEYEVRFNFLHESEKSSYFVSTKEEMPQVTFKGSYPTKAYFEVENWNKYDSLIVSLNGNLHQVVSEEILQLENLEGGKEYLLMIKSKGSNWSDTTKFTTLNINNVELFSLQPLSEIRSKGIQTNLLLSVDTTNHNIHPNAPLYLKVFMKGLAESYEYRVRNDQRTIEESVFSCVIEYEQLIKMNDIITGLVVDLVDNEGNTVMERDPYYLPLPFRVLSTSYIEQGDEKISINISNANQINEVLLDGEEIDYELIDNIISIHLPQFLGTTQHHLKFQNDQFFDEVDFKVNGSKRLGIPELSTELIAEQLTVSLSSIYGASDYQLMVIDENRSSEIYVVEGGQIALQLSEGKSYAVKSRAFFNQTQEFGDWSNEKRITVLEKEVELLEMSLIGHYPGTQNPIRFSRNFISKPNYWLYDNQGILIEKGEISQNQLNHLHLKRGFYILIVKEGEEIHQFSIIR
ncbi:CUB domain-containing protein [Flammeovirga pacifica]|uniref:CUB domain-containing protein n=1 Tax=Flammeovirga pacifica TaxID=915059 RepID=A0A1S1Z3Z7_FLAPC|nr:CUB domain-containing protein [Flammeovirga pacifica]OHX67883.1 hypothetical protein NH26_16830 [Flammeovirga pacifica]